MPGIKRNGNNEWVVKDIAAGVIIFILIAAITGFFNYLFAFENIRRDIPKIRVMVETIQGQIQDITNQNTAFLQWQKDHIELHTHIKVGE
jgi:predicted PurR-regulated permease PerM